MCRSELLARQMAQIGRSEDVFSALLQSARGQDTSDELLSDGARLEAQLRGPPDSGAHECMASAARDAEAIESFLNRWRDYREQAGYGDVLAAAEKMLEDVREFRDSVASLSPSERREVEGRAQMGRNMMGKDGVPNIVIVLLLVIAGAVTFGVGHGNAADSSNGGYLVTAAIIAFVLSLVAKLWDFSRWSATAVMFLMLSAVLALLAWVCGSAMPAWVRWITTH